MYIWQRKTAHALRRRPPGSETGGGKMGYGSYKTPRTQGLQARLGTTTEDMVQLAVQP